MKDVNHPTHLNELIAGKRSRRHRWVRAGLGAVLLLAGSAISAGRVHASTIVGEYAPGVRAADLGGDLVVNSYGVTGLGVFHLSDGVVAVCVEAHVSYSVSATYGPAGPAMNSGALDYLLWRYLGSGTSLSDTEAAGLNVAVWGITGAQRSVGGTIWNGGDLDIRVLGVGTRDDIESAARSYLGEAQRRRGPWTLGDLRLEDKTVVTTLTGPGGAISGRSITFAVDRGGARVWEQVVTSGDDGRAEVLRDETLAGVLADGGELTVRTEGPGRAAEYAAPGSQRLAGAGVPVTVVASLEIPPVPMTTTVPSTTSTTSTTSATVPETTSPTTIAPPSTTSSTTTTTTTTTTTVPVTTATTTTTPTSTPTPTPTPTTTPTPTEITAEVPPPTSTTPTTNTTELTSAPPVPSTTPTTSTSPTTVPPAVPTTGPPPGPPPPGPPRGGAPPGLAFSGSTVRSVMRIGAWLFAIGGVIVFAAAEAKPRPRRYVDRAGRAVDDPPPEGGSRNLAVRASTVGRHGQDHEPADR